VRELFRLNGEDGSVVAQLAAGEAEFWVAESPEHKNFSPESLGRDFRAGATVSMATVVFRRIGTPTSTRVPHFSPPLREVGMKSRQHSFDYGSARTRMSEPHCLGTRTELALSCRRKCPSHTQFKKLCTILRSMSILRVLLTVIALSAVTAAQQATTFPTEDGGLIYAELYGKGARGVVLAHGGRFTKESWRDQAQALAAHGFHVLAFDFRGLAARMVRARLTLIPLHFNKM
jgi:hypothetical protein